VTDRKKLLLRLDPQVYEAVAKWAADDLRSVNAQIEYALRLALRSVGRAQRRTADGRGPDGDGLDGRDPGGGDPDEGGLVGPAPEDGGRLPP
jgi:hypothetical protein